MAQSSCGLIGGRPMSLNSLPDGQRKVLTPAMPPYFETAAWPAVLTADYQDYPYDS